jgi:hypothetical protein
MPPGAKKSWRFGRFFCGAGLIEMGAEVDKVELPAILTAHRRCNFYNREDSEDLA